MLVLQDFVPSIIDASISILFSKVRQDPKPALKTPEPSMLATADSTESTESRSANKISYPALTESSRALEICVRFVLILLVPAPPWTIMPKLGVIVHVLDFTSL